MKKIIGLLVITLLFAMGAMAQDATVARGGTNFNVALTGTDLITNTGTLEKIIGVGNKQSVQLYSIQVTLDSISGTPAHTTVLAGSIDNSFYTTISTVSWAGSSSDTTFIMTDISTGVAWPYLRVKVTGSSSSVSQLTKLQGRFLDEVR